MVGADGAYHFPRIPNVRNLYGEVMNQETPETAKILELYRKLSCALDLVETNGETDDGGDDALQSLTAKIRELSIELEQLLDSEDEGRGADFDLASKIRVIEREISTVVAAVRSWVARTRDRSGQSL